METIRAFLKRKNIVISSKRYAIDGPTRPTALRQPELSPEALQGCQFLSPAIDALGAMAQGLFCSLLIGTIVKTLGEQTGIAFLVEAGAAQNQYLPGANFRATIESGRVSPQNPQRSNGD